MWKYLVLAAALAVSPQPVAAQDPPKLIEKARIGTVREVEGAKLPVAVVRADCPTAWQPVGGGPCFDTLQTQLTSEPMRVLVLSAPPEAGRRFTRDLSLEAQGFWLFHVSLQNGGLVTQQLDMVVSDITVPRGCYALNSEGVGYVIAVEGGTPVAYERQVVSCDGGQPMRTRHVSKGEILRPGKTNVHHRTEQKIETGAPRYLAVPGGTCAPLYKVRETWCARSAITHLINTPTLKSQQVIAALRPVSAGAVLRENEVEIWEIRRKGKDGFHAESLSQKWSPDRLADSEVDCALVGEAAWHVTEKDDGRYVSERGRLACGAPRAPVPTDIYEVYGEDLPVIDCFDSGGWEDATSVCYGKIKALAYNWAGYSLHAIVLEGYASGRISGSAGYDVVRVSRSGSEEVLLSEAEHFVEGERLPACRLSGSSGTDDKGYILKRSKIWATPYRVVGCEL